MNHHRDFFVLPGREVAIKDLSPNLNIKFFAALLVVLSPLMLLWGWQPVVAAWAGAFWHLLAVYEACHAIMHYDAWLPRFLRDSRLYRWWKGCHFAHHRHSPTGNYCVTFPIIDWCMGTYVRPKAESEFNVAEQQ
jgi:sterol desaturase/sphingolipid hydroxylase (fatty acid hydroxylase superfamily)